MWAIQTANLTSEPQLFISSDLKIVRKTRAADESTLGRELAGAGQEEELATTTFTVTQVVSGPPVTA